MKCVELETTWAKGYLRLARAKLGRRDGEDARAATEQARNLGIPQGDLVGLVREVEDLMSTPREAQCDPTQLACWQQVQYKDAVIVVDHRGSGAYFDLRLAVLELLAGGGAKPTTIIVRSGCYRQASTFIVAGIELQIIGEGDVTLTGSYDGVLIHASDPTTVLTLQNLKLHMHNKLNQDPSHCVDSTSNASVIIERCSLDASAAAVVGRINSSILMTNCLVPKGASAGVLLIDAAKLVARSCTFTDNLNMAVEARDGGSFELFGCTVTGCQTQAAVVWMGGADGLLEDCSISNCGQIEQAAAAFVCCGNLQLVRCQLFENRGDAVVMEARNDDGRFPSLVMRSCIVRSNGQHGVALYGGNASLEDNRIQENANVGMTIHPHMGTPLVHLGRVTLTRNEFSGNDRDDAMSDIAISGCNEKSLRSFTFDGNSSAPVLVIGRDDRTKAMRHISKFHSHKAQVMAVANRYERLYACSAKTSFRIDTRTGLKLPLQSKESLRQHKATAKSAARMQRTLPAPEDVHMHFHKQSLIEMQEREARNHEQREDLPISLFADNGILPNEAKRPSLKEVADLDECRISELATFGNCRAAGKILYGSLCASPTRLRSVMSVLADDHGAGVRVAFYNLAGVGSSKWRMCFPKGLRIGLKEPFLKRYGLDAGVGIRVDHPSDVVFVSKVCASCGVMEAGECVLKQCGRCKLVSYCSKDCQVTDWKAGHKHVCTDTEH